MPTNKPVGSTPRSLLAQFLDAFAWRYIGDKGAWRYEENARTQARRAVRLAPLNGPQDTQWLAGGRWDHEDLPWSTRSTPPLGGPTGTPPSGGSSGQRPRIQEADVIAIVVDEDGAAHPVLRPGIEKRARQMSARPVVRSYHVTTVDGVPSNVIELR